MNVTPLALTVDYTFKQFFKGEPTLLKSLLQNFLPLPSGSTVEHVRLMDSELLEYPEKKYVLDIVVKINRNDSKGKTKTETVNVEIQTSSQTYFTDRLLAYASRLYSGQMEPGEDYTKLATVYALAFSTVNLPQFRDIQEYYHVCTIRRNKPPEAVFSHGMQFVVVELKKFVEGPDNLLDNKEAWCYLLKKSDKMEEREFEFIKKKGKDMAKAVERLWKMSHDDQLRAELEGIEKQRRDQWAREDYARKEGREEGREERNKEVALQMLAKGLDIPTICECTGLTEAGVKALKAKQK